MAKYELFESLWLVSGEKASKEEQEKLDMMVNMGYNVNSDVDHDLFEMEMRDGEETQTD
jgi:hypothetical protein